MPSIQEAGRQHRKQNTSTKHCTMDIRNCKRVIHNKVKLTDACAAGLGIFLIFKRII